MEKRTLVLTSWYMPHKTVSWRDAITLVYLARASRVVDYSETVSSPSITLALPAVVRLHRSLGKIRIGVRFSRANIFARDNYRCQYCGDRFRTDQLTFDHVVPRSLGGATDWTNIVAACQPCNGIKGGRRPIDAKMRLLARPRRPQSLPIRRFTLDGLQVPAEWTDFVQHRVG